MGNSKKVMLIGWDAADWKVIHGLMDRGYLPTIKHMVENGVMGNMRTLSPAFSPMLWTSIATGKRPFKHGICGFYEPGPDGKSVQPMTNLSRKCKAIWNILHQQQMESLVVGWWPSHPAEPINGAMVSDYFHKAPKRPGDPFRMPPKSVHPAELAEEVAEFRVHPAEIQPEHITPFVPYANEIDQETDGRLSTIMRMLAECSTVHAASTHLVETKPWDFCAVYHDAIDHFSHSFMNYHPPQRKHVSDRDFRLYSQVVDAIYIYHDMMLNRMLQLATEDTTVIVISDHGFHPDHLRPEKFSTEPAAAAAEHRDFGIFIAMGPGIKKDHVIHEANLLDVTPTILTLFDLPVGADMDGKTLTGIFEESPSIEAIESWESVDGDDGQHPADMELSNADSKAALEQLVALGYIDPPDENSEVEIRKSRRELDFNLARSYMDADMHGEAIPLLHRLYCDNPLEYRFGIQLCNCLYAMSRFEELEKLIGHLNSSWRVAADVAKVRIRDTAKLVKERKAHWRELKKLDDENDEPGQPRLAQSTPSGQPILLEESEKAAVKKLRGIAKGNPQTLDFLAAVASVARNDFEAALEHLERAGITQSRNPGFQFQVGNVYLGLKRIDDAEKSYLKAVEMDEFHANSIMGLCRTFLEKNQPEKAIEFGRQAIGLKYHFPLGHFFYGCARERVGDSQGAIQSWKTSIEQNPNFAEAHEKLAAMYSKLDLDAEAALEHRSEAKNLRSDNKHAATVHENLNWPEIGEEKLQSELPVVGQDTNEKFVRCLSHPKPLVHAAEQTDVPSVVVVSGLPRTGTSMMMQMLVAGGLKPYTDLNRQADESNPKGYFEVEQAKQLASHNVWVENCDGQVVKIVAPLIRYLPQAARYQVLFMDRDISEVMASQKSMLERLGNSEEEIDQNRMGEVFKQQARFALTALKLHGHSVMNVGYSNVVEDPQSAANRICEFLDWDLDPNRMAAAVDPSLYREK